MCLTGLSTTVSDINVLPASLLIQFSDLVSSFQLDHSYQLDFQIDKFLALLIRSTFLFRIQQFLFSVTVSMFLSLPNQDDFSFRLLDYFFRFNLTTHNCITNLGNLVNINLLPGTPLYSFFKSNRKFICFTCSDDASLLSLSEVFLTVLVTNDIYRS